MTVVWGTSGMARRYYKGNKTDVKYTEMGRRNCPYILYLPVVPQYPAGAGRLCTDSTAGVGGIVFIVPYAHFQRPDAYSGICRRMWP